MTPPKSLHESLDNLRDNEAQFSGDETHYPTDFDETFDPEWAQEEELGAVTGPPTKEHWKVSCKRAQHDCLPRLPAQLQIYGYSMSVHEPHTGKANTGVS